MCQLLNIIGKCPKKIIFFRAALTFLIHTTLFYTQRWSIKASSCIRISRSGYGFFIPLLFIIFFFSQTNSSKSIPSSWLCCGWRLRSLNTVVLLLLVLLLPYYCWYFCFYCCCFLNLVDRIWMMGASHIGQPERKEPFKIMKQKKLEMVVKLHNGSTHSLTLSRYCMLLL